MKLIKVITDLFRDEEEDANIDIEEPREKSRGELLIDKLLILTKKDLMQWTYRDGFFYCLDGKFALKLSSKNYLYTYCIFGVMSAPYSDEFILNSHHEEATELYRLITDKVFNVTEIEQEILDMNVEV